MKELMCLNEDLIQQWIDGELSEELLEQVNQHLANCELCRQKAEQQKALAFSIKNILQVEDVAIPEFRRSETATGEAGNHNDLPVKNNEFPQKNSTSVPEMKAVNAGPFSRTLRTVPLWLKIAAVLIPAFCLVQVLIQPDNTYQPSHDELLMYQSLSDMDANAAFQERVMVTTSTNQEGEIVDVEIR